jgi:hypothetical protein
MATCPHSSPRPQRTKTKVSVPETTKHIPQDMPVTGDVVQIRHASLCRGIIVTAPGNSYISPTSYSVPWPYALSHRFINRAFFVHLSSPAVFKFWMHYSELEYILLPKFRIISPFYANFDLITILNFRSSFMPVLVLHNFEHPKLILYDLVHHNPVRPEVILCQFGTS